MARGPSHPRGLPAYETCEDTFEFLLNQGADLSVRARCRIRGAIHEVTLLEYALARQESDLRHTPHRQVK